MDWQSLAFTCAFAILFILLIVWWALQQASPRDTPPPSIPESKPEQTPSLPLQTARSVALFSFAACISDAAEALKSAQVLDGINAAFRYGEAHASMAHAEYLSRTGLLDESVARGILRAYGFQKGGVFDRYTRKTP